MTDTGQVPGEGLPENAGMVEQPGASAHGAYAYLSETTAEDEDLLLLPGAQSPWGNEVAPPAPEPVVEAVHEPGPHETAGRDSGSVDLGGVRLPNPTPAPVAPRRPLHLGPPIPDASASPVRSLADRGPAGAPVRPSGPATSAGPEYLDAPHLREMSPQGAVPWGAQAQVPVSQGAPAAETVGPATAPGAEPVGAAQAVMARITSEAYGPEGEQVPGGVSAPEGGIAAPVGSVEGGFAGDGGQVAAGGPAGPAAEGDQGFGPVGGAVDTGPADGAPSAPEAVWADAVAPGPETEAAPEAAPVPEAVQDPEAAIEAEGAQATEAVVPEGAPAVEAPVPVGEEVAEAVEPEGGRLPEAAVPDAVQAPETVAPETLVPQPAPLAEAPAPDAVEQVARAADLDAAEAVAPEPALTATVEPALIAEPAVPTPAPETAEAVPAPEAAEAAPAPEAADVVLIAPPVDTSPASASPPAVDASVEPAPAPQPTDAEYAAEDEPGPLTQSPQEAPPAPEAQPLTVVVDDVAPDPAEADAQPPAPVAETVPENAVPLPEDAVDAPEPGPAPEDPAPQPLAAAPAEGPQFAQAGQDEPPLGEFVAVEGSLPTTPHLAPTPPHAFTVPVEQTGEAPQPVAVVPGPRQAGPELVQRADDLDTRAADQEEESTAAVEEVRPSTGPAAPAYDDAEREAVMKVMRERRDIRNGFRGDPIPHEVLLRVLEAAHTAPSVGHSQPWDFVVIRSAETRRSMHELAMRQRDAYAKSLPKGRAKQFKELKIEAILDTPVNIVVTADPTRGGRHTLGRHTQPQMAPYSAALAVENLWLAARAEGLGVGWVSFFDEREMVRALGLPEHLEVIAYLCVGYVDEFPDEPELMQAGWSKRRPLSWVVHEETYGRRALPGEEPHDLLAETVAQIRPLDAKALGEAWERQKRMTKPAGALGMLEIISAQLSGLSRQCPPPIPEPAAVAIFAGDHGVHAQGVTPWPQEVTAQMVANFLGGGAVCNAFAGQVGAEVCVVDVGVAADLPATPGLLPRKVRAGTSDMTTGPAMTREEAKQAIEVGIETARDLVAAGNKALLTGEMGIANTTASAALISVFTDTDPAEVTGRGTGINDETLARKTEVVRRAIEVHQPDPADPIGVLAAIGGFEHAAIVGLLLGGASLRTPVILDGVSAGAAALVARAIAPEVLAACIAGHRSAEPGHVAALNKLGLRPLVDLDLRLGEGTGALLALPLVQSTARAMHEVATFDSAGVTEK
jgi:nicotinate-nucleotide--dimethylbenzimidazole phosphoribosyltransferase